VSTSDTDSVDCCFCEIAPKSNFVCNGLVQRRHHYHLVNKKHVLPFGHLELNNNHSLNILVTAMPIRKSLQQDLKKKAFISFVGDKILIFF
jgi:hypothetical protein